MPDFSDLDPLLHNQLRLSVMSVLISTKKAEFNQLLEKTGATRGNLSANLKKLSAAEYITVEKAFRNNYPLTTCHITDKGIDAFETYVKAIEGYLKKP